MKPIFIANWKMNLTLAEGQALMQQILSTSIAGEMIIAPPIPYVGHFINQCAKQSIARSSEQFGGQFNDRFSDQANNQANNPANNQASDQTIGQYKEFIKDVHYKGVDKDVAKYIAKDISFAAQDVSIYREFGAHTGEISANMLKSCGISHCIIGHSERRVNKHESNQVVRTKFENLVVADMVPILCVGESLETRQKNHYIDFILEQIRESMPAKSLARTYRCIIAYEPIWAIGTGITPTISEITEIIQVIKDYLDSTQVAKSYELVYGGSVNAENYAEILAANNVSGLLMGKVSLQAEDLLKIISF